MSINLSDFQREILGRVVRTTLINTLVAIFITYVVKWMSGFWINWVFCMCIGTIASTLGFLVHRWMKNNGMHKHSSMLIGFALAIPFFIAPVAVIGGSSIAALLFNYSVLETLKFHLGHSSNVIVLTAVVCIIATWFFWMRMHVSELKINAEKEKVKAEATQRQASEAQLKMLQTQIEPHMLFNTLANLQGLIDIDPPRAQLMLGQLIIFLRSTLSLSRADSTTLEQESELLIAYLNLIQIRMGKRLQFEVSLPDSLRKVRIAPMLLQPIVENAIKHGLEPKVEGGKVNVEFLQQGKDLLIRVIDTGLGLQTSEHKADQRSADERIESGVGNVNIRQRIAALYGERASFQLHANQPSGTIAELFLPSMLENTQA